MGGEDFYPAEAEPATAEREENPGNVSSSGSYSKPAQKKHRGWKAISYILGNETFERLTTTGLVANFMVYLMTEFHLNQVTAASIINSWTGVANFAYAGRFKTIAFASFAAVLGVSTVTLTAWLPRLHPPKCDIAEQPFGQCMGPQKSQMAVVLMGLVLLSIGSGGIRPCGVPFGIDQFDKTTEKGVKGSNIFFNWYYTSCMMVVLISQTALVYVQNSVSWVLGFGIPTVLMLVAIVLFFMGTKIYVLVEPEGGIFSGIAQARRFLCSLLCSM